MVSRRRLGRRLRGDAGWASPHELSSLADLALRDPALWFSIARAVRPFSVFTSGEMRSRQERGGRDRVGFFPVLSRSPLEIVLGEDNHHLDFRLALPDGQA